jgi:hypothetical protein
MVIFKGARIAGPELQVRPVFQGGGRARHGGYPTGKDLVVQAIEVLAPRGWVGGPWGGGLPRSPRACGAVSLRGIARHCEAAAG